MGSTHSTRAVCCSYRVHSIPTLRRHCRRISKRCPVHVGPHTLDCSRRQVPLSEARRHGQMAGYTMDQLLRTPGLIDIFNRPDIVDFVELSPGMRADALLDQRLVVVSGNGAAVDQCSILSPG